MSHRTRRQGTIRVLRATRKLLSHPSLPFILAGLGMALSIPTLWRGWVGDDLIHRTRLLTSTLPQALTDLYTFLRPDINLELMDLGTVPWWTLESVRATFFRPLTVLTLWLDYQLWPDSAFLMHVHNVLWYGLVCVVATLFYRRFIKQTWVAGLAAFLFTVDLAHVSPVASMAGRNILLTVFFGMLTITAHDRWRREGWKAGALLAPLGLVLALLSAEAGLAVTAFLAAYALFLDQGTWRSRIFSLISYAAIVVIWRLLYQSMGYGAYGSGFYIDPGREPLRFVNLILERGPLLLFGQWSGLDPAAFVPLTAPAGRTLWVAAVLFLTLLGAALTPLVRWSREARFWCLGMLLSILPICAVNIPSGRLLIFVGLGAMGLTANFVASMLDQPHWLPSRRIWRYAAWTLCFLFIGVHAALSPILIPFALVVQDPVFRDLTDINPTSRQTRQDVVIVNIPSPGHSIYLPGAESARGHPIPDHLRILAPGYGAVYVTRIDPHTVLVRPQQGYLAPPGQGLAEEGFITPPIHIAYAYQQGDRLFRSEDHPMEVGQEVSLTGATLWVTALTPDGRPAEALVRFEEPLDDQSLEWLEWSWEEETYVPFRLPAVGETVRIPGPTEGIRLEWSSIRNTILDWAE